jgi:ribose transport system ATP-binding protein
MSDSIIEFLNINKKFGGIYAVKDVSFTINKGEVHTIIGENGAGKSTLMNMLSGLYMPDGGKIIYKDAAVSINSPFKAKELGISTVFQELKLCGNLTVVENIFLGRELRKKLRMDWNAMTINAHKKLTELGLNIDVRKRVGELSTAQMQLVEIARAMFINSDVLILDEPTSSLTYEEAEKLFKIVSALKNRGVTIIFISHRMEEVFQISDRISIMRNGKYLGTYVNADICSEKLIALISGKKEEDVREETKIRIDRLDKKNAKIVLEVKHLNRGNLVKDISFKLHEGEMLGFYGLQGSGRTELMETIYGLSKADSGEILLDGENIALNNVQNAINHGIVMVPEDRKQAGLFMNFDLKDNIATMHGRDIVNVLGGLNRKKIWSIAEKFVERLSIRSKDVTQMVQDLSGGNQQKVVISKCLSVSPRILIMDEPTRGVDVGAKSEIFRLLRSLQGNASATVSIIVVSSEISEIVSECDRVLVIKQGRIVGELKGEAINKHDILQYAFEGA